MKKVAMHKPGSLLVFSDDWGRHPSSCQHLIKEMLADYPVVWVNTIGMRTPKLDRVTLLRALEKLRGWMRRSNSHTQESKPRLGVGTPVNASPTVISPRMWPWFTRALDRRLNRRLLAAQLRPVIETMPGPVVAITTIPITADLPGALNVERWVYYCVDDFSQWPGLDGATMASMDRSMISAASELVAVSETLQRHIRSCGRESSLLTHGVHLSHWQAETDARLATQLLGEQQGPRILFWGVIDERMDVEWIDALAKAQPDASILLAGPMQNPDPRLLGIERVRLLGPVAFDDLPMLAAGADVLVMPYVDAPVTRAMQPLKLKEYLATGRPVVVRDLPATHAWSDCMDVTDSADAFVAAVQARLNGRLPAAQATARARLEQESWAAKARQFEQILAIPDRI